eukprot:1194446-Prorocentrum_minimum.AAC.3
MMTLTEISCLFKTATGAFGPGGIASPPAVQLIECHSQPLILPPSQCHLIHQPAIDVHAAHRDTCRRDEDEPEEPHEFFDALAEIPPEELTCHDRPSQHDRALPADVAQRVVANPDESDTADEGVKAGIPVPFTLAGGTSGGGGATSTNETNGRAVVDNGCGGGGRGDAQPSAASVASAADVNESAAGNKEETDPTEPNDYPPRIHQVM